MRPTGQDERERVAEAYAAYRANPAKQRSWRADNPGNQAMRAELVAVAMAMAGERLRSGGRVLDVGCGTGWWLRTLAGTGVPAERLSGADVLPARVERARAAVPGATIVSANARTLPFGDGRSRW